MASRKLYVNQQQNKKTESDLQEIVKLTSVKYQIRKSQKKNAIL